MRRPTVLLATVTLLALPGRAQTQNAQDRETTSRDDPDAMTDERAFPVPFGPGERAVYELKLGILSVGEGRLEVIGVDSVRGHPSYQLEMGMQGSKLGLRVNDLYTSWLDTRLLVSRRFVRDVHQINYKSRREFELYPEERRWERADEDKSGRSSSNFPLDELAFIYYIRTLPLEVGETYELSRYFKEEGNPVVVKVLRRDVREVPAGTFNTIVVQPIIQTDGLFSEGGEAEVHFSDDADRHVVYLRSALPFVGSLSLHLREVQGGVPLNPRARRSEESQDPG